MKKFQDKRIFDVWRCFELVTILISFLCSFPCLVDAQKIMMIKNLEFEWYPAVVYSDCSSSGIVFLILCDS